VGRLVAHAEPTEEQPKMIGIDKPEDMTPKARRQELAGLLAKGFLRLRKRVDYPEIMRRCHVDGMPPVQDSLPEDTSQSDLIQPAQPSVHWYTD
jgi:hypothetical protein